MSKKYYHKIGTVKFVKHSTKKNKYIVKIVSKPYSITTTSIITCSSKKTTPTFPIMKAIPLKEKTVLIVHLLFKVTNLLRTVSKQF